MVKRKTNPRTHIVEVQKRFEAELYHRLIRDARDPPIHDPLKPEIGRRVIDEDALGLRDGLVTDGGTGTLTAQEFDFPENPELAADFETWLNEKIEGDVLHELPRNQVVAGDHWTAEHIRAASRQGVKHGDRELRRSGFDVEAEPASAVVRAPVHQDMLQSGYLRAYDELDGISSEMATEISRSMSEGLAEGLNPRETASRMNERVDVGLTRSRRLARTESSRVYNNHSLARFDEFGVAEVDVLTFEPCDLCQAIAAGGPYSLQEARGLVPGSTHPNCVCSLTPAG